MFLFKCLYLFASIILLLFCCKDTTISPNIQGYPRFLSVCVSKSKSDEPKPEKPTNVSHFISRGLFCNYQKDVAARRAATSMFWFKENRRPPDSRYFTFFAFYLVISILFFIFALKLYQDMAGTWCVSYLTAYKNRNGIDLEFPARET